MKFTSYALEYTRYWFQKLYVACFQVILYNRKDKDIVKFIALLSKQNHFPIKKHNIDTIIQ